MNPLPSRLRIALLSAGISGLVLIAFGAVLWRLIQRERLEAVDREIRTLATRRPGMFAGRGNPERLAAWLEFTFGVDFTNRVVLRLEGTDGTLLFGSPGFPEDLQLQAGIHPPGTKQTGSRAASGRGDSRGWDGSPTGPPPSVNFTGAPLHLTARVNGTPWRFGILGTEEVVLTIGLNQKEVEDELRRVRSAFLGVVPLALFAVGFGGWLVAGQALRPLQSIADTAELVTAQGLNRRIPDAPGNPEAGRVIQVLNRMMDRLEASFSQANRFSADASHELKTPLAVMQGELEQALQATEAGSSGQILLTNLLEETHRLKTITRSLLLLAQADGGRLPLALEEVDLGHELEEMLEDARVLGAESHLAIEFQGSPVPNIQADRALIRTAVFNLLVNAIRHNEPDGRVAVRFETAGDRALLSVGNTGPGIPPEDQNRVFDRFFRSDRSRAARARGTGLGLSLAREIARGHGGDLVLRGSRPGWTTFELTLPLRPVSVGAVAH